MSFLKREVIYTLTEFQSLINYLNLSLRAENQGVSVKLDNNIMSEIHKKRLAKNKGELKLPTTPLVFTEHCSNKLIKLMTDGDNLLKEVKKAVEEGRPFG